MYALSLAQEPLVKTQRPWLREDGTLRSIFEIKLISEEWDQNTWEQYLVELESPQQELLLGHGYTTNIGDEFRFSALWWYPVRNL